MNSELFTIGCSAHSVEAFIALLNRHEVQVIADVRSTPFSRFTPQFNAPALKAALTRAGIFYIPMGEEFGARRVEVEVYREGRVDFDRVSTLPVFQHGVERIRKGHEQGRRIALMCTEKDPMDCHRFVLVSRNIERELGLGIAHILANGSLEATSSVEDRMMGKAGLQVDMFNPSREILVEQAYTVIGLQIAYSENAGEAGHD